MKRLLFLPLLAASVGAQGLPDKPLPSGSAVSKLGVALTLTHAGVASWDWTLTRQGINAGGREIDPLARPFVHNNLAMVAGETVEVVGTAWAANLARHSENRVLRRTWWLWQAVPIVAHIWGIQTWYRK